MGFTLGNGRKIRFWEDAWLGQAPLKDKGGISFSEGIIVIGKWKEYAFCSRS